MIIEDHDHQSYSDCLSWHNTGIHSSCRCLGNVAFCHKPVLMSEIPHFDVKYHVSSHKLVAMDVFVLSGKIFNAALTFCNSFAIAFAHKVSSSLASRMKACFTVLGSSMPNWWLFLWYLRGMPPCHPSNNQLVYLRVNDLLLNHTRHTLTLQLHWQFSL